LTALRLPPEHFRYRALIGVGGIGSGTFFALQGNETLGREESRLGRFLDRRDYCKLHIITHYVSTLLGPDFMTLPVGRVGSDENGHRLLKEMADAGLDTRFVKVSAAHPTLYSFCFVYPDGSGGNLTTDDSACSTLDAQGVAEAEREFERNRAAGIALAVPEVPLGTRTALLGLGRKHGFLNVASFTSEEVLPALDQGMLDNVDLLALNRHEAASVARTRSEGYPVEKIVATVVSSLAPRYPRMILSVTAGSDGSWIWDGRTMSRVPKIRAAVSGTAGAGDAHLAGLIVGLAARLGLEQAHELAGLVASFSVTSPHTIPPGVSRETLCQFAVHSGVSLSKEVKELLE